MSSNLENNVESKENVTEQTQIKFIRCPDCGEKILMSPTLGEMIEAIDHHVSMHRKESNADVPVSHLKTPNICMDLTKQVLQRASDMIDADMTDARQKPSLWL